MNKEALTARLRALFVAELEDRLGSLNADLVVLEGNPKSSERLDSVFRTVHTLKGAAHAAAVPLVENVCHALETLLAQAREGQFGLGPADFEHLFAAADALADATERMRKGRGLESSALAELQLRRVEAPAEPAADRVTRAAEGIKGETAEEATLAAEGAEAFKEETLEEAQGAEEAEAFEGEAAKEARAGAEIAEEARPAALTAEVVREAVEGRDRARLKSATGDLKRSDLAIGGAATPLAAGPRRPGSTGAEKRSDQVRVTAGKIDALFASSADLLLAAGKLSDRPRELASLHETATRWRSGWTRTAHELRVLVRRGVAPAALLETADDLERNLDLFVQESGRLAITGEADTRSLSLVVTEVGDRVLQLRVRPFGDACAALPRSVRDLASASGKEVVLEILGGEVEADREVIDSLQEVLLHLVRNAVDHGIEPPEERERLGKPRAGTVTVAAALDRQRLQVIVRDDGRGLDLDAVRAHVQRHGLPIPERVEDLVDFVFQPGFSTRDRPTKVSGRGMGLDVVRTTMERIHGAVQVTWTEGAGTAFTLESPPSLATMQAVLVTLGSGIFAIASAHVEGLLRVRPEEIRQAEGQDVVLSLGSPCPIVHLASLLGSPPPRDPPSGHLHAVHLRVGARALAVVVDELVAVEEIIIRPVERLPNPPGYLGGASLLRNGRIALVLNAAVLISAGLKGGLPALLPRSDALAPSLRQRILVVDDSLTTRALEQSILQAEGFDVLTANDGEEGWRLLQDQSVDLVVSDVDMPRMNGFELCRAIRASRQFADLPIILVTAKEEAEHRELGMEAGADAYLPKSSFDQQSLLDTIQQLLGYRP